MQLVILAAGHGRRFGGLKQLTPIGPQGEALMDYTVRAAEICGYLGLVVVIREEIRDEICAHVRRSWPRTLPVEFVIQGRTPGTAEAVSSTRPVIDGPFAVANADDYYGPFALAGLLDHFERRNRAPRPEPPFGQYKFDSPHDAHLLVAYRLANTVINDAPVNRALCEVGPGKTLRSIREYAVARRADGTFDAIPAHLDDRSGEPKWTDLLVGTEDVSMNLWGFHRRILDHLDDALAAFDPDKAARPELLLPDVLGDLLERDEDSVVIDRTDTRCFGVTYPGDVAVVRDEIVTESRDPFESTLAKTS